MPNETAKSALPAQQRELELLYRDEEDLSDLVQDGERVPRRSPAARFGSNRIGAAILPDEMQDAISSLIAGSFRVLRASTHSYLTGFNYRSRQEPAPHGCHASLQG
jgi:hypothetical protein